MRTKKTSTSGVPRRNFLKGSLATCAGLVVGQQFSWAGSAKAPALLLEAAQFHERGGWGLDQQFMDQMGSGFLLAHGLGDPVADAVAKVKLPETGKYKLWVRTRDWVATWKTPGTPDTKRAHGTPGVFKVLVDGKPVETVFGDRNAEWHWQDGGTVEISSKECEVALHDLTGFDGRCAAVFLTKDTGLVPPHGGEEIHKFRRAWHGFSDKPDEAGKFDLVVVGGGIAGACAAVKAARLGVKVALIQDRPMVGGNNSSEVRMWLCGAKRAKDADHLGDILALFEEGQERERFQLSKPTSNGEMFGDDRKNAVVRDEENITFFPLYRVNRVEMDGKRVVAVIAESSESSRRLRFAGRHFADCTGDGCVGYLAGADFEIATREESHMGRSNQWHVEDTGKPQKFPRCPWALDLSEKPFPGRKGAGGNKRSLTDPFNSLGMWFWEAGFNHDPFEKNEYIRDWNLRAMFGAWDCLKNVDKVAPNHKLEWAAFISGKRESRRLLGDLILNEQDVTEPVWYDDGLVPTDWKIDVHYPDPRFDKGFEGDGFISTVDFKQCVRPYYIPYRCFYSRTIDNLFMAGRDISVTREALGTVRVMRTCGLMGEIVGMAASLCIQHQVGPRAIHEKHLRELKELCGYGDWTAGPQLDVREPGEARRTSGSKQPIASLPDKLGALRSVIVPRGEMKQPAAGFTFKVSAPATVYLAVHDRGGYVPPTGWEKTALTLTWSRNITDTVYRRSFQAGVVEIPGHDGKSGAAYGIPHAAFVQGKGVRISRAD